MVGCSANDLEVVGSSPTSEVNLVYVQLKVLLTHCGLLDQSATYIGNRFM